MRTLRAIGTNDTTRLSLNARRQVATLMWMAQSGISRRAFNSLFASAALALPSRAIRASVTKNRPAPPYHVLFLMGGGSDSVMISDPKRRPQVEPSVDIPYKSREIITTKNLELAPLAASLAPHADNLSILHGLRTATVAHHPGLSQVHRMKLGIGSHSVEPSLLELIGSRRTTQPVPAVCVHSSGGGWPMLFSPGHLESATVQASAKLSAEESQIAAAALRRQSRDTRSLSNPRALATADRLEYTAKLLDKLPSIPKFEVKKWSDDSMSQYLAAQMQQILWLIENDLTLCVSWAMYAWDSHDTNLDRQTFIGKPFLTMLSRFFEELSKVSNHRGLLSDNTNVILASELGRNPVLNSDQGKHHFPEVDYVLYGKAFASGKFGETGRMRQAKPVSLKTGKPEKGGAIVTLEDLGTTLVAAAGLEPTAYGYRGQHLNFLV